MKFIFEKKYFRIGIIGFLVLCGAIMFYFAIERMTGLLHAFEILVSIFAPFVYGIVMAYLLCPIYNFLMIRLDKVKWPSITKKDYSKKINNIISVMTSITIFLLIIAGLLWAVVPTILESVVAIVKDLPESSREFVTWTRHIFEELPQLSEPVEKWIDSISNNTINWVNGNLKPGYTDILEGVSDSIIGIISIIKNFSIGLIICALSLYNKETFSAQAKKLIFALMKEEKAEAFLRGASFTNYTFGGFINGKIIDSIIIGIICFIFMTIFGWPYPTLISVIIGVTNIIPFFGPFIGAIPSTLLMLTVDPMLCLYFMLFILVLQQVDGNIIGPKILGEATGLPTFWVMFAILIGGGLFGFIGMILGIPILAVIYAYFKYKVNVRLEDKNLTTDLEEYKKLYVNLKDGQKSPWSMKEKVDKLHIK